MRAICATAALLLGCGEPASPSVSGAGGGGAAGATTTGSVASSTSTGGEGGGGGATWTALPPLPNGPRQETAVVALDGRVVVLGGFDGGGAVVSDVEVYDPGSGAWSAGVALPEPMHHANAAVVDGKLYVLGLLTGLSFTARGDVHVFDPAAGAWAARASMPAGTERGSAAVGVIGSKIYLAGGYRGGSVADCSAYDTTTDSWETLADLPVARDHQVGAAVAGVLFAIGGRTGDIEALDGAVLALDPASGAWQERAPMPTPRGGAAAAALGTRVFVFGGEGNVDLPTGVFDDTEAYDAATDSWEQLAPMPTPRHGTGAAAIGGTFYVPGGADTQAFGAVDTVEAFTP